MTEKTILVERVNPARFFGPDNQTLKYLKLKFPTLKISSRGNEIKISGSAEDLNWFEQKLESMFAHLEQNPKLAQEDIDHIMEVENPTATASGPDKKGEVLVFGPHGRLIKVRTKNQARLVEEVENNDIVFAVGPAGTGKTYTAVALAVRALKNKEIKRIILARPAVEAGESLGFLPGDLREKIDPYLKPLYDSLQDMLPTDTFSRLIQQDVIEIVPMAFMRGRTLDNCFVLLDEAQNATHTQLKMFLTRMGPHAKVIITGDLSQVDLPRNQKSGLRHAIHLLQKIRGIKVVELDTTDVIRHRLVKEIIKAYDSNDEKKREEQGNDKTEE